MFDRIRLLLAAAASAALLTATMAVLDPAPAYAAPHDCTTTARAAEMVEEAEKSAGDAFGCINRCPCGGTWVWDGERWVRT
jgi:hypothetical protein